MKTTDYLLSEFMECKPDDAMKLNSIVLAPAEFFDKATSKTLDGFGEAVWKEALSYLTAMYRFASQQFRDHKDEYAHSDLEWDVDLVNDALNYLVPEQDLHWGFTSSYFYLELDNWDLYTSVVDTINDDFKSGYKFKYLTEDYTTEFYGGEKQPAKYEPILL